MDQFCPNCTQTTDNSTGACRFCGATFPAEEAQPEVRPEAPVEADGVPASKSKK